MEEQFSLSETFKNNYGGDYSDIENELKEVYINFGKDLGWEYTNHYSSNRIEFKSGVNWSSWRGSWGEIITVNFSKTSIGIKSVGIPSYGNKNKENCERFMSVIVPWVEEYLKSKESERLNKEKK